LKASEARGGNALGLDSSQVYLCYADRLPVQLDSGNVGGRNLRVQLGELVEEGLVDNAATIQLDWQPIGADWLKASEARGGNALGLDSSQVYASPM
jgi:hypothetical protein